MTDDLDADIARMIARRRAIETIGFSYYDNTPGPRGDALTQVERNQRSKARYRGALVDETAVKRAYRARKKEADRATG